MPQFGYRALTASGEVVTGEITAPDRDEVFKRIEFIGLIPLETMAAGDSVSISTRLSALSGRFGRRRCKPEELMRFLQDLAMLLKADLQIDAALELLGDPGMSGTMAPLANAALRRIRAGESVAQAFAAEEGVFSATQIAVIRVGEASARLGDVVHSLAQDAERNLLLADKIRTATRYPLFLLLMSLAVLGFFLLGVIPQFAPLLSEGNGQPDPILAVLLSVSSVVRGNPLTMLALVALTAIGIALALTSPAFRNRLRGLPGIRPFLTDFRTARFCRTLGLLIASGVHLSEALEVVVGTVTGASPASRVVSLSSAASSLRQGRSLAEALQGEGLIAPPAVRLLLLGERSGRLASMAAQAADLFEARVERRVDAFVAWVGPVAIIAIAAVVGFVVVTLMTSLLSIGQLAQ